MIEICKKNALVYSRMVCRERLYTDAPFHPYYDWSDHVAVDAISDYPYHLNITAKEVKKLAELFEAHFDADIYAQWAKDWFSQTVAAAWVHDIGMLIDRNDHGTKSAYYVLEGDSEFFDFSGISFEDRIKIALLCIRHHRAWPVVYGQMKRLLQGIGENGGRLKSLFEANDRPFWGLALSGKLISTADFLRYRGMNLRNDLGCCFSIWSTCPQCQTIYAQKAPFCDQKDCSRTALHPYVTVEFDFDFPAYDPNCHDDLPVFQNITDIRRTRVVTPVADERLHVGVRTPDQIYTLGDMALCHVQIQDIMEWWQELRQNKIDTSVLVEYMIAPDRQRSTYYRFVVHASLDETYPQAALFSLNTYIAQYLEPNITTSEDVSGLPPGGVLLHLQISSKVGFELFIAKIEAAADDHPMQAEGKTALSQIRQLCNQWLKGRAVLPLEVVNGCLKVVNP